MYYVIFLSCFYLKHNKAASSLPLITTSGIILSKQRSIVVIVLLIMPTIWPGHAAAALISAASIIAILHSFFCVRRTRPPVTEEPGVDRFSSYLSGRCTFVDMLRSSPACSRCCSAPRVGNRAGTAPSETCGSNNTPSIIYLCLAAANVASGGVGAFSETHNAHLPISLYQLPAPFKICPRPAAPQALLRSSSQPW